MAANYSTPALIKIIKQLLENNLTITNLTEFLEGLAVDESGFDCLDKNMLIAVLYNLFDGVKQQYSAWDVYLMNSIYQKAIGASLEKITIFEDSSSIKNSSDINEQKVKEKTSQISQKNQTKEESKDETSSDFVFSPSVNNTFTDVPDEVAKAFKNKYKVISKKAFPDIKFPSKGQTDILYIKDNLTIPGEEYQLELKIDSEGTVQEIQSLTKIKTAENYEEIYHGLLNYIDEA